jgi:peptidyl-prolyl cis-trans isomerase D
MISQIQKNFQQHFRIVFGVVLVVTIVSFIFTIGAAPGIGRAGPKTYSQLFFGHDLSKQGTSESLFGDASLSIQLQVGYLGGESSQVQDYGLQRTAALAMSDQLKLPSPTADELTNYIRGLQSFAGTDGQFDPSRYASFRDSIKANPRLSEADVSRVLNDDIRISQLRRLVGGPGYVLPGEVREQLIRADSNWTIDVATTDYAEFKPEIPVPEDALKRYFEENSFRYTVPPRIGVDYVEYHTSDFLGGITLTPADVRAYYDKNPDLFPKPAEAKTDGNKKTVLPDAAKPSNSDADFAAVRAQVEQTLKTERAARMAAKAAADLTVAIYDEKLRPHTPAFDQFLAQSKLALKSAPAFQPEAVPSELGWDERIVEQEQRLTADRPVSDPLSAAQGSLVLFWRETLPSYQPQLAEVRTHVIADFQENERRKNFVASGRTVRAQLEARLKAGDSFEKAAASLSGLIKLTVKEYPAFPRRQPPQELQQSPVLAALERLGQGQVSDLIPTKSKSFFVYVREKKNPDMNEASPLFSAMQAQIAQQSTNVASSLILHELITEELKKNTPATGER